MVDIPITYKASKGIIRSSRKYENETGGILVGTINPLTIINAAGPGPNSVHQAVCFTSDPEVDKACLNNTRKQYGEKICPVGWWHKHPGGFNRPSSTDCQTVRELAAEYDDSNPILMGIVNRLPRVIGHKTTLHLYNLNLNGEPIEHNWKLVKTNGPEITAAIEKAIITPTTRICDFWTDIDFQFYQNPKGRKRIKKELTDLRKSGWRVNTKRLSQDKILLLELYKPGNTLYMALPPEFPLNPPVVFVNNGKYIFDLKTLKQWNSLRRLDDVADEFFTVKDSYSFSAFSVETAKEQAKNHGS